MSTHQAHFTWGPGPNSVFVAGNFNNWSATATPLHKLDDGTFAADISLPWGEKQAFKYVVDGEWKVREDEAKEWDAAGNMNNVYTAPHAPAPATSTTEETAAPVAAAAAVPVAAAASTTETTATKAEPATEKSEPTDNAPPSVAPAAAAQTSGAEAAAPSSTEPSTLLASSAPAAASTGTYELGAPVAPVPGSAVSKGAEPVTATAAVPIEAAPATSDPTPVKIQQTAAHANIGQAPTTGEHSTLQEMQEKVAEYGAGALGALGVAVGGAVAAVEKVTGVDLAHGNPLTVDEAKAKGIDVNSLPKTDVDAHATSPAGTKPPVSAVEALEEKTQELKSSTGATDQAAVPLPNGKAPHSSFANAPEPLPTAQEVHSKHDLPAQNEQADKHKEVPAPVITPVAPKDPRKDRTLDTPINKDTAGTKPIDASPAVSAVTAKKEAEAHPAGTGSTPAVAQGKVPTASTNLGSGEAKARPDATNANKHEDVFSPPTPAKDTPAPAAAVAPATPTKDSKPAATAASTPASTPAKSTHGKDGDIRKRKSSFFSKIKHAFSPKDKEKK